MEDLNFLQLVEQEKKGYSPGVARKLAFYVAGMSNTDKPVEAFQQSMFNLENYGEDAAVSQTTKDIQAEYDIALTNVLGDVAVDPTISTEDKMNMLKNAKIAATSTIDLEREAQAEFAAKAGKPFTSFDETYTPTDQTKNLIQHYLNVIDLKKRDRSILGDLGDVALSSIPFANNEVYLDVAEKLLPEFVNRKDGKLVYNDIKDAKIGYLTSPGDISRLLRMKFARLKPEDKPGFIKEFMDLIRDNAGYADNSLFIQEQMINNVFGPYLNGEVDPDSQTGWELLDNVIYGLDVVGLGKTVGMSLKKGASLLQSPLSNLILPDPEGASELIKLAANDDDLAKQFGVSQADLTEIMIPGVEDFQGPILNMEESKAAARELLRASQKEGFAYTQPEKMVAAQNLLETIRKTSDVVPSPSASTIDISIDNSYFNYKGVYLNSEGKPFDSVKEANLAGRQNFDSFKVVPGPRRGTHVITVEGRAPINRSTMKTDVLSFNDHNVFSSLNPSFVATAPSAKLSKEFVGMAWQASRRASKFSEKFSEVFSPFIKLNKKSKHRVSDVWVQGSKEGKVYDIPTLESEFKLSLKETEAYYAGIRVGNVQYVLNNRKLYQALNEAGYGTISNSKSGFTNVAKPYNELRDGVIRTVYDSTTDSFIPWEDGMQVATLKSPVRLGDEATPFILLNDDAKLSHLTKTPLKYRKGYIPRYYENNYFITATPKVAMVNGVKADPKELTSVVHAVDSSKEAKDIVEQLKAQHPDMDFAYRRDRNTIFDVESLNFSEEEYQLAVAKGNMFFKGRGAKLGEEKFAGIDGSARVLNPVQSIVNSFQNASFRAGYEDLLNSFKDRFINDFGHLTNGKFPGRAADIVSDNPELASEVAKARSYWKYINTLQGDRGWEAKIWRKAMLHLGEWIDDHGFHKVGAGLQKVGKKDPFARSRGIAFNSMIAGNPLRQFAIQTAQYLSLTGFDPAFVIRDLPGAVAFKTAYTAMKAGQKEILDLAIKEGARHFKMSEKQFKGMLKDFEDSGLVAEISSHSLARDTAKTFGELNSAETLAGLTYQKGRAILSKPFQLGKRWGFAAGEANARAFTYLMARRQWIKKHPTRVWDEEAKREVNNLTEALVYSMNRGDQYTYQDGFAGLIMQFFQVQHKAIANILPTKLGGSKFTEGFKGRMALGQLLMYGAPGLGLGWLADKLIEHYNLGDSAPVVKPAIEGGLMEMMINEVLDTDLSLSESLSPTSDFYNSATKFFVNLFTADKPVFDMIPASHVAGRFNTVFEDLKKWNASADGWDSEQMTTFINDIFKFASGYKNAFTAYQMYQLKAFVDKNGSPVHQELVAESMDAWAKLFGFNSKALEAAYELDNEIYTAKQDVKELAKSYYEYAKRVASTSDVNLPEALLIIQRGYRETLSPDEYYAVEQYFHSMMKRDETILDALTRVYQARKGGFGGEAGVGQITRLLNEGVIDEPTYEQLKKEFDLRGEQ